MNPTTAVFEERVANLEGGAGAVAFASGIAAQNAALFTLLEPGDHVVSSSALYGGTVNQFKHVLRKMNVELTLGRSRRLGKHGGTRSAANTKAFFGETIGNPGGNVLDIEAVAAVAHDHGLPLIVDNTFADAVPVPPDRVGRGHRHPFGDQVHRRSRHEHRRRGRRVRQFNWSNGRFPVIADPSPAYHGLQFHETFGTYGYLMKLRAETLRDLGAALSPFNAFLFLQGLETLSLRMERHVENALAVAAFLESHELASNVTYPGLPVEPVPAAGGEVPAAGRRCGVLVRLRRRPGRRAGPHPRRDPVVAPGQRRRREEPHHPPRQHDAPAAQRRRAAGGRRRAGDGPAVGRYRVRRRSDLGPGAGLRAGRGDAAGRSNVVMTDFDLARYQDPLTIQRVLHTAKTIAIVGLSSNELRASYFVGYYLKRHGYQVIPVNPRETEILGEKCYPSLLDVPVPVDIVNVFRAPDALPGIAAGGRGDRRRHPLVPVRRDQRGGRADRRRRAG